MHVIFCRIKMNSQKEEELVIKEEEPVDFEIISFKEEDEDSDDNSIDDFQKYNNHIEIVSYKQNDPIASTSTSFEDPNSDQTLQSLINKCPNHSGSPLLVITLNEHQKFDINQLLSMKVR